MYLPIFTKVTNRVRLKTTTSRKKNILDFASVFIGTVDSLLAEIFMEILKYLSVLQSNTL